MLFGGTTTTMMMMMSINAGCNECFGALNTEECISFTDWSRLLYGRMAAHTIRSLCRCWAIRCPTVCFGFCLPQLTTRKTRAITLHNKNKSYWLFFALALAASFQRNGIAGVSCWPSVSCGWPSARYAIHFFCLRAVFSFCFIFFFSCCWVLRPMLANGRRFATTKLWMKCFGSCVWIVAHFQSGVWRDTRTQKSTGSISVWWHSPTFFCCRLFSSALDFWTKMKFWIGFRVAFSNDLIFAPGRN